MLFTNKEVTTRIERQLKVDDSNCLWVARMSSEGGRTGDCNFYYQYVELLDTKRCTCVTLI